ncbi:hypothetical protein SARC_09578 [Sphaeroforma arctica JP610]|uniref:Uncharacterized protein n=1 Tax=Sphaeroforma arctica JP610 TaxID=667725 RepID=A0A0L0FMJ2_9EUKA|nr:hypothetical protein SARC_09578 [Sphaeroforma arctica JP610]KNC77975.1 hypothetical protein SARC_09578 [Sphaeroforma arctica JP610]|eukprot:XP_014151877.1 hypothetical protein SARC_09578 [Sphaeroforma arctica JP610]
MHTRFTFDATLALELMPVAIRSLKYSFNVAPYSASPCPLIDNKQRKESFAYNAVINDGDMALPVGGSESGLMQINQDTDAANETKNEVINENPMKEKPRFHRTWFLRRRARLGTNNDAKLSTREEQGDTAATERIVRKHRDCYNSFFGPLHRLKADKHRARKCARLVDSCSLLVLTVGYVLGIYLIFKLNTTDQASNFAD